jgi:type VI secretion system secreted protein VgrG
LVQYNESTYNFAARLLQDAGIYFYFGLENARHKLFLADAATQWEKIDTAFHYYQDKSNDDIDTAIYSWQRGEALVAGKVLTGYTPFLKSTETLNQQGMTVPTQAGGATLPKNYEKFFYLSDIDGKNTAGTNSIKTAEDLDKKARDIGHSESLAGIEIHSSSTCSQIASGRIFKLETHPDADEIGAYRIVQVSHQARDSADELIGAQTEKEPAHYSNSFVVIPEALTYRPLPLIEKPKASSLSRAKVVSKSGKTNGKPTVDTDEYGRVKVQFFWDRHKASSAFLRVAHCWAGGSWGMNFIPRVGDEVLVGFIDGDPDQPLIVGSVPNHSHPLPYKDTASKSGIRSLSLNGKKAHEICFDDSAEKEKLVLRSDKEIVLEVGKTTIVLTEGGIKLLGKRIDVD